MAKKRKGELPSGNIRVKLYIGMENGKKKYKSFTAPTRAEAKAMAAEWKANRYTSISAMTVSAACERYINLKRAVLSPSTIKGYGFALKKVQAHPISQMRIDSVQNQHLQIFVSDMAAESSPKSVANVYGFVTAAMNLFVPGRVFNAALPKKQRPSLYIPSAEDVQQLLDACRTPEMKLAVLFAAIGTMRRGEACAVTFDDVDLKQCTVSINKAFVETEFYTWEIKAPKTYESYRTVHLPGYAMELIDSLSRDRKTILNMTPDRLYVRFSKTLKDAGLPHFRYHDLRHYAASQMHASGVPERYIEAIGGWRPGSNVLKRTYENVIDLELKKMERAYLDSLKFKV